MTLSEMLNPDIGWKPGEQEKKVVELNERIEQTRNGIKEANIKLGEILELIDEVKYDKIDIPPEVITEALKLHVEIDLLNNDYTKLQKQLFELTKNDPDVTFSDPVIEQQRNKPEHIN